MQPQPLWRPVVVALVCIISLIYALPTMLGGVPGWWPGWLPNKMVQRGLDLQGGLHLLLHVETDKAVEQIAENLVDDLRGILREQHFRYSAIDVAGIDQVVLRLPDATELAKLQPILEKALPTVKLSSTPEQATITLQITPEEQGNIKRMAVDQSIQTIRSRIDQFGVAEPTIQRQGEERVLVQLPGLKDPERAKSLIGRTARLDFKLVDEKGDLTSALRGRVPPGDMILYSEEVDPATKQVNRQPYLLFKRTVVAGSLLTDARVNFDNQYNEPYVGITFNSQGARKFAQVTGEHVGERLAIVLDGKVYSAPVIRDRIDGGRAQITGQFTPEEAHDLAIVLRAGALPAPVTILEERTVGPTMGKDSIADGLFSTLIGGGVVLAFMLVYYKGFGLLANLAVLFNIVILIACLAALQATLTLPGIAGAVLLIGMSVDANVLIFERIREELRLGKTPLAAIHLGWNKAFLTILDSNLTTLITALILFQFGTGPVRGFAVTLSLGLIASMFTAIFMTRVMLDLFLTNRKISRISI